MKRLSVEFEKVLLEWKVRLRAKPNGDVGQIGIETQHGKDRNDNVEDLDEKVRENVRRFILEREKEVETRGRAGDSYDQHTPDVCENENGGGKNDEEGNAFILWSTEREGGAVREADDELTLAQ